MGNFEMEGVDLFCGGGGFTQGLEQACQNLGIHLNLTAINHNAVAIETHRRNHPTAKSHRLSLEGVNPRTLLSKKVDFITASPECIFHSRAAAGKPKNDQSRATAFVILSWMESHSPFAVVIENVPEFRDWGPLDEHDQPIKARKGETFEGFIRMMKSLGYTVDWKVLNAADYGDPTVRKRLFIVAVKGNTRVRFPEPTHTRTVDQVSLFTGGTEPWRSTAQIIDWSLKGKSVFNRKKPLVPSTLRRISVGLQKYCGLPVDLLRPETMRVRLESDEPVKRLLNNPYLIKYYGCSTVQPLSEPLGTLTSQGKYALIEPFALYYNQKTVSQLHEPMATITTQDQFAFIEPFIALPSRGPQKGIVLETPSGVFTLDLAHRMLSTKELARAMGFGDNYEFLGKKEDVLSLIGNAVPIGLAQAITQTVLEDHVIPRLMAVAA